MSTKKNAGVVTAYGAAVQAGYEGSYEDFCAAMADLGIQVGYLENMTVTVNILTPSSSASASYANGVLTLNIPRGNKGEKGDIGSTPNLTIGTVTTGEPGSSAAATITGTAENPVLNLTIPEGEKGDKGNPGEVPAAAVAGTQASTTASKALAVGEHFWLNGTLYTATSPIASGGTIVTTGSGKNCDLAVIGNELASQSEKIDIISNGAIAFPQQTWESGNISSSGRNTNSNYTVRTPYIPVDNSFLYHFTGIWREEGSSINRIGFIFCYSGNTQDTFISERILYSEGEYVQLHQNTKYIRITYGNTSASGETVTTAIAQDFSMEIVPKNVRRNNLIKALIAPILTRMKATEALSVNDFRVVGDTLYKITSPIALGGILTPNTNCVATTIGAEITAILNS